MKKQLSFVGCRNHKAGKRYKNTTFAPWSRTQKNDAGIHKKHMDIWDKKKRSAVMARIKSKDTKPEWIVRRYLYHRGYRYRKNLKGLPGTPDIVLPKYRVAIFVHGCFWHGHEADGHIPRTRTEFWSKKIERNKERDERAKEALRRMGWNVLTIWECQLKPAVRARTLLEVEYWLNHAYLERRRPRTAPVPYGEQEAPVQAAAEGREEYREKSTKQGQR